MGKTISKTPTLKCLARVSLSKVSLEDTLSSFYILWVGNEGLYSVGKEWEKSHSKKQQAVGFAGHSRLGLSRESLAETSLSKTLQIPSCAFHVTCFVGH